CQHYYSIPHSF
nr:immunoglobulin light chain junction region [Macaca mulatta]MPN92069.1 immunoglobulin light chain junction region [Macaca mulatta]MPN92910.1 immunoglobulin light chain junction region [Macaca mulatta]MPN94175.1 immunoglobulin light chain junction region [Macaca mulatta]MPN94268.1 immunoglobulin light chain junction region [Macaca mulatta]